MRLNKLWGENKENKYWYQRRTKKGVGWQIKTVLQREAVKTQRVEIVMTISAIDNGVRFFFIFLISLLVRDNCELQK